MDCNCHVDACRANCPEWIKVMLACSSCAAICVPLYDALGGDDAAAFCIVHSGMELVFVQACCHRHICVVWESDLIGTALCLALKGHGWWRNSALTTDNL